MLVQALSAAVLLMSAGTSSPERLEFIPTVSQGTQPTWGGYVGEQAQTRINVSLTLFMMTQKADEDTIPYVVRMRGFQVFIIMKISS